MDVNTITFGIKDVVAILIGAITLYGILSAHKRSTEKLESRMDANEKANSDLKSDLEKKELLIYAKITEVRDEQRDAHDKLSSKIDAIGTEVTKISSNLSELAGYLKAKKENDK